jgi:predicted Zn finger-like uncharacterized protein
MILSCNSCEKKFVVPDKAISASGRLVQCSSCGNKWKQLPVKIEKNATEIKPQVKTFPGKTRISQNKSKRKIKKKTGPNLYSPEYLAQKHGIKISSNDEIEEKSNRKEVKLGFGFYNYFITGTILIIFFLRLLYFSQNIIINQFPFMEHYISYLFESLRNIQDIIISVFADY